MRHKKFKLIALLLLGFGSMGLQAQITEKLTDSRDGKVYKTVKIGEQVWMAENIAYKPASGSYWSYNNNPNIAEIYGYLYNWETACDVCPKGWHLPSEDEWNTLINYLGGKEMAGGKLKETDTIHWNNPNLNATNESGFSALPGGFRFDNENYFTYGYNAFFWSSTELYGYLGYNIIISNDNAAVGNDDTNKEYGFSVRCIKD